MEVCSCEIILQMAKVFQTQLVLNHSYTSCAKEGVILQQLVNVDWRLGLEHLQDFRAVIHTAVCKIAA